MSPSEKDRAKKIAKEAYEVAKCLGFVNTTTPIDSAIFSNEALRKFGSLLWPLSYQGAETDKEAFTILSQNVREGKQPDILIPLDLLLHMPSEQIVALWAARWVDQGCPRVVFDAKYAALLMSTDVSKEVFDKVVFPWRSFMMEIPSGLLTLTDADGSEHEIQKVLVHVLVHDKGHDVLNTVAIAKNGLQLWRHGVSLQDLTTLRHQETDSWGFGLECDSRDDRVLNLLGRLTISLCVALSDPDNYHKQKHTKGRGESWRNRKKGIGLPEIQTFVVGKPVSINCRAAILDYLSGRKKGKSPTVQFLVRGHWKYQAYGPNRSKRKLIQIEPYWKGPEDGKILSRTVKMEGEQND